MPYNPAPSVQGVSLRITRLDELGNLLNGPTDSYIMSSFIRVSFTPEWEEGEETTEKDASGRVCAVFKPDDTLKRMNFEVAICDPDPEVTALLSGGVMLSGPNALNTGDTTRGWASVQVGEAPSGNGVAIEVWSRAIVDGKPASTLPYYQWVFPYVKLRVSGDRVIENGILATTFEGTGLGNINFRNGPDGAWLWPAVTNRPYLYARVGSAPQGLRGFFTYPTISTVPGEITTPTAAPGLFSNVVGTNIPGSGNPYPYDVAIDPDYVLSSRDYHPEATVGALPWEDSAATSPVVNAAPTDAGAVHNTVTYIERGGDGTDGG